MALSVSLPTKNAIINQIINDLAGTYGTAGTAELKMYTGSQPANADAAPSGTLLCTISPVSWAQCTGGTSAISETVNGTAVTSGTTGWARFERIGAAGTYRLDGDTGTGAASVFVVNNDIFSTAGAVVSLLTAQLYMA